MEEALKILVVDDDDIDRIAIRRALQCTGIELRALIEVETYEAAIATLEQECFDCAIVDYHLPDGDGLDLLRQIRDRGFPLGIIAMTGQGDERLAVELMKAGANDYLSKNRLSPEQLYRSVLQVVRINRAERLAQETTQQLRESEERYRLVLEGSNDGIWDWYICENTVYCNDRMYDILGISVGELGTAKEAFARLIHPDDQAHVLQALRSHLQLNTPFDVEFRLQHSSGNYRYCTSRGKAQRNQQGTLFRMSGIVSDITQTKQTEKQLRQAILVLGEQQQQLRTLQRLTDLLNQHLTDLPGLLQSMIDAMCETISGCDFGLILLNNPQTGTLDLTATTGMQAQRTQFLSHLETTLTQVFQTGEFYLSQRDRDPSISASLCAVPIESPQAGRQGVLAIGNWLDPSAFDQDDVQLLMAFSEQAAIAINTAQLIKALEDREAQLARQNARLTQQNQELENQRQQIQLQNLELTEAAQVKAQFLATMSHELRTPMNAIMGFSQLLLRQKTLTPSQLEMAERILSNSKNLLALINDILDLSKIEAGKLELKLERLNLPDLVLSITEELRSLAHQKQLALEIISDLTNPWVMNDSFRFRQILANLLSNAIKFTDVGRVVVRVWEVSDDRIALSVEDTGIGIASEDLDHIFEEFRQLDQSIARRHPGTGLGLAITKWLVQLMQGSISVESQLGQGSTFTIEFPRTIAAGSTST